MTVKTDKIIVVGGGLLGASTLYELAADGIPAVLLEAESELGTGASFANGGLLTAGISDPWNGPGVFGLLIASLVNPRSPMKLRMKAIPGLTFWGMEFLKNSKPERHMEVTIANFLLSAYSLERTRVLRERHSLEYDAKDGGCLKVFANEAEMAGPLRIANYLATHGLRVEQVDTARALEIEPSLGHAADKIACGLYYPDECSGDPWYFTRAIAREAEALGAEVRTGASVRKLVVERGRVVGVELDEERVLGEVVIAAGIDSPGLLRRAGLRLPIKPVKGYSLTVDASSLDGEGPRLPVVDDHMHAAVSPLGNRLRFVGTAEFTGRDRRIRQVRIDNLFALFERLFPHLVDRIDWSTALPWTGLRPMSADGAAFVGASGVDGLWINSGHGHMGWTMAAGSARMLVDLMQDKKPAVDPAPLDPRRRKRGG